MTYMNEDSLRSTDPSRPQKLPLATIFECSERSAIFSIASAIISYDALHPIFEADLGRESEVGFRGSRICKGVRHIVLYLVRLAHRIDFCSQLGIEHGNHIVEVR